MFGSGQSSLIDEIKGFRNLKAGWNSYSAPEISEAAVKTAIALVDIISRCRAPLPSAAPTPLGGVAFTWALADLEAQLLVDEESLDFSVARRGSPKIIDQGSVTEMHDVQKRFIERYLIGRA